MISVVEARRLVVDVCTCEKTEKRLLLHARGYVLAAPVTSPIDTPPFHQSAMDGYAFAFDDWDGKQQLEVCGVVQAGSDEVLTLNRGQAVRIFTGAAVPAGADTVVIQEHVRKHDATIEIDSPQLGKGANVRPRGSQTTSGSIALARGQVLTTPAISFLASIGIDRVEVYSKPNVSIIVTGKELVPPGEPITSNNVYECNSFGLTAGLDALGITPVHVQVVDDVEDLIRESINSQLHHDVVIITGGVSVGDYDFVPRVLEQCGVERIFHGVKQKPGKPVYFGKRGNTFVFGLPGNPASVLTCFYEYVIPAISGFTKRTYHTQSSMKLANSFKKKPGLTYFLKGKTDGNTVTALAHQESYLMDSYALADCLVELAEGRDVYAAGDIVDIMMVE